MELSEIRKQLERLGKIHPSNINDFLFLKEKLGHKAGETENENERYEALRTIVHIYEQIETVRTSLFPDGLAHTLIQIIRLRAEQESLDKLRAVLKVDVNTLPEATIRDWSAAFPGISLQQMRRLRKLKMQLNYYRQAKEACPELEITELESRLHLYGILI